MNSLYGLGGWFNNVLGILEYFRDSALFSNSARMQLEDASILEVIQRGLRGYLSTSNVGNDAANDWKQFFAAYYNPNSSDGERRRFWGAAEQKGVDQAQALSGARGVEFTSNDQEVADYAFVNFGNIYRFAVANNQPILLGLYYLWYADPRNDRELVYYFANAFEGGQCLLSERGLRLQC